jgi:signal peptidase I
MRLGRVGWLALPLAALSLYRTVRRRWSIVTVHGSSMAKSLPPGQRVLIRHGVTVVATGDIVLIPRPDRQDGWQLRPPSDSDGQPRWMLKRVVAVAGDPMPAELATKPDELVPAGRLVLLGEHDRSWDSRQLGPCPTEAVAGKVVAKLGGNSTTASGIRSPAW